MTTTGRSSLWANSIRGAVAGAAGIWLMDLVTTGLLQGQSEETTRREEMARPNGKSVIANLVDRSETALGLTLNDRQRRRTTQAVTYGLGIVPGALYGAVRGRVAVLNGSRGLVYGLALWILVDESMTTALGVAGPFSAYPIATHWRGLVGHAVLGIATDTGIDLLGG